MRGRRVVVKGKRQVELEEFELDESELKGHEIIVENKYTMISPGTELSIYTGLDPGVYDPKSWCHYPFHPGYAGVGRVVKVGDEVEGLRIGDVVYGFFNHASICKYDVAKRLCLPIPSELDEKTALVARFATIGLTAVRVSSVEPGDHVLIIGLGIIGNLAAQLFREAGAFVVGTDLVARRRELLEDLGIKTLDPLDPNFNEKLLEVTEGLGPRIVVDAVGDSKVVAKAVDLVRRNGEVIILGTPRASFVTDVTPIFRKVHLNWITIKGALEWCFPQYNVTGLRHSYESNTRYVWELIRRGRLKVRKLITHVLKPEGFREAYEGLLNKKNEYLGVIIDWT